MWDATSDIGLVSEVLFAGGFKCVARKFSAGKILPWWGGTVVAWFGFELLLLNKVPLLFINHGGNK